MHSVQSRRGFLNKVVVHQCRALHAGRVVDRVGVAESEGKQPVVFGRTCRTFQHIGGCARHVNRHKLVDLHFILFDNVRVVGLKGAESTLVHAHKESAVLPLAVVPKGVAVLVGDHLNPGTASRIA